MSESRSPIFTFPHAIDSTMRGAFASCPRKFYWEFMRQRRPLAPSVHLHAGGAFASGMEAARRAYYERGETLQSAKGQGAIALTRHYGDFVAPALSAKTLEGMLGAYSKYFEDFPMDSDPMTPVMAGSRAMVEFSFAIPIPGTRHPDTGEPVLYFGRCDMIGQMQGSRYVVDEKTTSQLGASWSKQWDMRGQFTGYCWAAAEYGYPVKGAIIRGVSILKRGYETAQAITYRPQWRINEWLSTLQHDVNAMIRSYVTHEELLQRDSSETRYAWYQNLDSACSSYGGCSYMMLCDSNDPEAWLDTQYRHEAWGPENNQTVKEYA